MLRFWLCCGIRNFQRISVKSEDGTYVEVPEDVQKYAIRKWVESKGEIHEKATCGTSFMNSILQLIICLLIVFIFMYSLSCFRKGMNKLM